MSGKKGAEAERLVEGWLRSMGWQTHRAAAAGLVKLPNGKCFVRSHDLFGAFDILAIRRNDNGPETWALQVTTQKGRGHRRRRLEHRWPVDWRVSLVSHETTPDPAHRSRKKHWVKSEDYFAGGWTEPDATEIDPKAIEAFRKAQRQKKGSE